MVEHLVGEVADAVAGGLGAHERAAVGEMLAGERCGVELVGDALHLAEHIADLAAADADIPGGAVGKLADVTLKLGDERLAEAHDLVLALAVGVEV